MAETLRKRQNKGKICVIHSPRRPLQMARLISALCELGYTVSQAQVTTPQEALETSTDAPTVFVTDGTGDSEYLSFFFGQPRKSPRFLVESGKRKSNLVLAKLLNAALVTAYNGDFESAALDIASNLEQYELTDLEKLTGSLIEESEHAGVEQQKSRALSIPVFVVIAAGVCTLAVSYVALKIGTPISQWLVGAVVGFTAIVTVQQLYRYLSGSSQSESETATVDSDWRSRVRLQTIVRKEIDKYAKRELSSWLAQNSDRTRISAEDRETIIQALEGRIQGPQIRKAVAEDLAVIVDRVKALECRLSEATQVLSEDDRKLLVSKLSAEIEDISASEVLETYAAKIATTSGRRDAERRAEHLIINAEQRLVNEISVLTRRANVNLTFGAVTALAGVILLIWVVLRVSPPKAELSALLSFYSGRYGVVGIVEVFAYFFLRLYKNGLSEIKFFQNEVTSLQLRAVGLHLAMACGSEGTLDSSIEQMVRSERNRILEKGQSTIDLEARRLEDKFEMKALKLFAHGKAATGE